MRLLPVLRRLSPNPHRGTPPRRPLHLIQVEHPLLDGFGSFPAYFRRLPEVNRRGPRVYGTAPALAQLDLASFRGLIDQGVQVVDARPIADFAAAHIPGSLSIELRPVFATWLGWLVDASRPVVFVLDDHQDHHDLVRQALDVGVEELAGELVGGWATWEHAGLRHTSIGLVAPDALAGGMIDVRQRDEYLVGHVPGARHIELGALSTARDLPAGPVTVMCGHGERAMTGASVLERAGHHDLSVLRGGPPEWVTATGGALVIGE